MADNDEALRASDPFLAARRQDDALRASDPFLNPPEPPSTGRLKDFGVNLARGMAGMGRQVEGLVNLAGSRFLPADRPLSQMFANEVPRAEVDRNLTAMLSPQEQENQAALQAAASGTSLAQSFGNALGTLASRPSLIPGAIAQAIPSLGLAAATGGLAPAGSRMLGGALAEGALSVGGVGEAIREQAPQNYRDALRYAVPAGAVTAATTLAAGPLGGNIAGRLAGRFAGERGGELAGGLAARAAKGAAAEGGQELIQSAQEQAFQNLGTDQPVTEGVGGAAAQGLVVGAALGAGGNAAMRRPGQPIPDAVLPNPDAVPGNPGISRESPGNAGAGRA